MKLSAALALCFVTAGVAAQEARLPPGWVVAGSAPANYEFMLDTAVIHGGRSSARITFLKGDSDQFGTLMQTIQASPFRGKRLMLSAWLRTENAESAQLWMRVNSSPTLVSNFDNMDMRPVRGTTGWHRYSLVLDIARDAQHIAFGAMVNGKGRLWLDDLELQVVEGHIPSTNMLTPEQVKEAREPLLPRRLEAAPVNLGLEPA